MTNEELLIEIEDLLRSTPDVKTISHDIDDNYSWLGRVTAVVTAWNFAKSLPLGISISQLHNPMTLKASVPFGNIKTILHEALHDLRMKTAGPVSIAVQKGMVFDYFEELRKVITLAVTDILFIDPYMDAEFVSRYLPLCQVGISIRLLAGKTIPKLLPAVDAFNIQNNTSIKVRSTSVIHDRYIIIDGVSCYQSGASFNAGAKKSPVVFSQITDAFSAVKNTYESIWSASKIER